MAQIVHVDKAENPITNPSKSDFVGGDCSWRMTKGNRDQKSTRLAHKPSHVKQHVFWFVLPKRKKTTLVAGMTTK